MEQDDETQAEQTGAPVTFSLGQKAAVFVPTAVAALGLDALIHAPLPLAIAGVVGAYCLARKSPELYQAASGVLPLPDVAARSARKRAPGDYTLGERLLGKHLQEPSEEPEPKEESDRMDEVQQVTEEPTEERFSSRGSAYDAASRNTTAARVADHGDDLPVPPPPSLQTGMFVFSSVLERFSPTVERIYLGTTAEGLEVYTAAEALCHVALAGSTDNGKSSIMRLLMAQLCRAGAQVLLLNPHYTRYDLKKQEDWTPFEPYLLHDPMQCRKYEAIEYYLKYAASVLLPGRLERYAHSEPTGKPCFLILDELPSIIKHIPAAPGYLGELLREGRKAGLFLISASQDFLVKTIAPDGSGGAVRDCYRTAYYAGGDATTAKILLDMEARKIPEDQLGKGSVMLRCASAPLAKKAKLVRVPYVDNAALYRLLGPSTYQPPRQTVEHREEALPRLASKLEETGLRSAGGQETVQTSQQRVEDVPSRSIPPVLREAMQAYQPGMSYRDIGRALGWSDEQARFVWQAMQKRGLLRMRPQAASSPSATTASQGAAQPSSTSFDAPGTPGRGREERVQLGKGVSLTRPQFETAIELRRTGKSTGYRDLMPVFGLSEHHAKELNRRIRQALGLAPECESE